MLNMSIQGLTQNIWNHWLLSSTMSHNRLHLAIIQTQSILNIWNIISERLYYFPRTRTVSPPHLRVGAFIHQLYTVCSFVRDYDTVTCDDLGHVTDTSVTILWHDTPYLTTRLGHSKSKLSCSVSLIRTAVAESPSRCFQKRETVGREKFCYRLNRMWQVPCENSAKWSNKWEFLTTFLSVDWCLLIVDTQPPMSISLNNILIFEQSVSHRMTNMLELTS